jgi:two-component system, LytTR family, sensor kinase
MFAMNDIRNWLFKKLWSRLGRNVIFWVLFYGYWWLEVDIPSDYAPVWYIIFRFVFLALILILSYFNNLILIPNLLAKKKYWLYLFSLLAFSFVISFAIALNFNVMLHLFPKMHIGYISFITTGIPVDYSLKGMIAGTMNYFFFIISWVCMFIMAWYMNDYARQQKIIEVAGKKQMETELNFLKGQMSPHFLFNNLNNLYGLALKKADSTPDIILKLSSILRYLLYESNVEAVSFEREKELMKAYIDLELLRLSDTENMHFTISADAGYTVPPLLWLPVLENVFKHATRIITDQYFIEYRFLIEKNKLTIRSKNNFKANGNGLGEKNGGIGLSNLKKRLEILYPGKHTIYSGAEDNYYITEVQIDLAGA